MSNKINEPASFAACLADRARDVASRADALAAEIAALRHDIQAAEREPVRQAGFRCDTATGSVRQAAGGVEGHCCRPGPHLSRQRTRHMLDPVGCVPSARQHSGQQRRQDVVPGRELCTDLGP